MATAKPKILYENRLGDAVPVASSTAAGDFDVLNLRDFRPYTHWQPATMPATVTVDAGVAKSFDYLVIWGHDLFTQGATIELRKSNDNFVVNDVLVATQTPTDDKPFLLVFTSNSERYTRITLTGASAPFIAIAAWGVALQFPRYLPRGWDPIGRVVQGQLNTSVDGHPLGAVIDFEQWKRKISFRNLTWTFVRTTWLAAWNAHLRSSPYVIAWDPVDHADELQLVRSVGSFATPHQNGDHTDLEFDVVGRIAA